MSAEKQNRPLHGWLPTVILQFLSFFALTFVLYEMTVGLGEQDLPASRAWVVVAGMVGLLLLPIIDRLIGIKVTPGSLEATLVTVKAQALDEVKEIGDQTAAETARAQILSAKSPDQVRAALAAAVESNVSNVAERVKEAIRQKRKIYVRYKPDPAAPVEVHHVAPLDIKPGKTPATRANDYLWVYSDDAESILSLRLGRVLSVELSEETFDPAALMAGWRNKQPTWNISRSW